MRLPSARVQVVPLLVAVRVWPATVTEIVAAASFTVPFSGGVVSFVTRVATVTVGATVSITNSFVVLSLAAFPAASVAVTATLKVPCASAVKLLFARVHVPFALFVAARV